MENESDLELFPGGISLNIAHSAKFSALQEKFIRGFQVKYSPMYNVKPMFNMVGGDVTPGIIPYLADQLGYDFIVGAGAALHGHVMGPKAGATAFRLPIDAAAEGVNIRDAAKKHRDLMFR